MIYNRAFLPLIQKSTRLPFLILDKLHALLFKLIFGFLNFLLNKNIVSFHRMNSSSLSGEAHFPIEKSAPILFRRVDVNHLNGVVLSWFGNSGAPHVFGVTDLLLLEKDLVLLKEKISFTLLIVSDRDEQLSYFSHLPIDICFVPWSMDTVRAVLQKSDLVLIPNRRNEFSVCKSANRIVFSIMNNLPVIATTTKANEFFEGDIGRPGNWCELILEVLNNKQSWNSKVISAKQKIETHLSNERLADLWRDSMSLDVTAETAQINSKEHHASYV